jgi:hypothetical protein
MQVLRLNFLWTCAETDLYSKVQRNVDTEISSRPLAAGHISCGKWKPGVTDYVWKGGCLERYTWLALVAKKGMITRIFFRR